MCVMVVISDMCDNDFTKNEITKKRGQYITVIIQKIKMYIKYVQIFPNT